jgi:hypothetical protein
VTDIKAIKWYHRPVVVVLLLLAAGPFALPLVWTSPSFNKWHKVVISVIVAAATVWLLKCSVDIYELLLKELKAISEVR